MTINTHQDLIDAISEAARVQEQAYNEIQRLRADHLTQAQRAAELQAEVDRLTDENEKLTRKLLKARNTIRRMEEGDL
jgi:peptidoglycan hydrolase CwlO-like protein